MPDLPYGSHELATNNGIRTIRSNTKVKGGLDVLLRFNISDSHRSLVEINGKHLVFEKKTNVGVRCCLIQEALIQESTID